MQEYSKGVSLSNSSPVVHDFQQFLAQLLHVAVKGAYASIDCSQPGIWVLDDLQWPVPLQVLDCTHIVYIFNSRCKCTKARSNIWFLGMPNGPHLLEPWTL
jgi:hypothetical protein